jgi:hypothetical protein
MPGFGTSDTSRRDIPLSRIEDMQRKGLSNNQIIQALQRDGFTSTQIFDALNQANMQPTHQAGMMATPEAGPSAWVQPAAMPPPPLMQGPDLLGSSNEELIEAMIDEKWNDLVKSVNKIIEWKDAMNARIERLEQRMEDMKQEYDRLHEAVVGKIGEYDKNILEVGAEVKAMEKVFSKVLPVFTENVAELSRITDRVKGGK